MSIPKQQKGFTIIELLFAMTVFSFVLLMALSGIVQIGRMYYKGVTTANVQEATRRVTDEITQAIQFTALPVSLPTPVLPAPNIAGGSPDTMFFCIGNKRYTVAIDRELSDNPSAVPANKEKQHVLWVDDLSSCAGATGINPAVMTSTNPSSAPAPNNGSNGRELLGPGLRVTRFNLQSIDATNTLWQIDISIAYGDEDLLEVDPANATRKICRGTAIGTQFCGFSEYSATIKKRVL